MEDSKKMLLVHRSMKSVTLQESVNVLLTPQFYTIKKEQLPIKYTYQAKRIAASIFEGALDTGQSYEYFVFKEGDVWVFIAYCLEEITDFLRSKGIALEQISKLFFAQQSIEAFQKPYLLSEREVLGVMDHTVVVLPRVSMKDEALTSLFDEDTRLKKGISLHSAYSSLFDTRQTWALFTIFMVFALLFVVEGVRYSGGADSDLSEYNALIQKNPSLESRYKRESIAVKYKKIDTLERKKRETVKVIGSMLSKSVRINTFHIDDKGFQAHLLVTYKKDREFIEAQAKKVNFSVRKEANGIKIEGKL